MSEIVKINPEGNLPLSYIGRAENLINEFISECDVRPNSKKTYRKGVINYFRWLVENKIELDSVTRKEVLQYKEWLRSDPDKISSSTGNTYLMGVKKFYTWAEGRKKYPNIAGDVKVESGEKKFEKMPLSEEETMQLIKYLIEKGNKRDIAMVIFMIGTATRTIEVSRANFGDIDYLRGKRIFKVHGKGRSDKKDIIILTDVVFNSLKEYWKERGELKSSDPIFISDSNANRGTRISTQTISKLVKGFLVAIGINSHSYTAHSLRHTGLTLMLRRGASFGNVQKVGRHLSPETTQIYGKTFLEEERFANAPEDLISDILSLTYSHR